MKKMMLAASVALAIGVIAASLSVSTGESVADVKAIKVEAQKETAIINTEVPPDPQDPTYLGEFISTGYCPCELCCGKWSNLDNPTTASGKRAVEGVTVGADWNTLPAGTKIIIDGVGERTVQDKPAKWIIEKYNGKILDVYYNDHQAALKHGRQTVKIWKMP